MFLGLPPGMWRGIMWACRSSPCGPPPVPCPTPNPHSRRSTQKHALRLDSSHLLGFQVAQHHHQPTLQFLLGHKLHQAAHYSPWLRFPYINLLHIQAVCIWVLPAREVRSRVSQRNRSWGVVNPLAPERGIYLEKPLREPLELSFQVPDSRQETKP